MKENRKHLFEGIVIGGKLSTRPFSYKVYKEDGGRTIRIVKEVHARVRHVGGTSYERPIYDVRERKPAVTLPDKKESRRSHFLPGVIGVMLVLISLPLLGAFEAHVINVTATIEQNICDARSLGYWKNNEGCSQGSGDSIWADDVNALSSLYSGAFSDIDGTEICVALWIPNCDSLGYFEKTLCKARAHTLADLLNIVSHKLALNALIAGADDGSFAFDKLNLTPYSTIQDAMIAIEAIITDQNATTKKLRRAAYVAERIYTFYEEENPFAPNCIFDPNDVPICLAGGEIIIENDNSSTIINNVTSATSTGASSVGDEGDSVFDTATSSVSFSQDTTATSTPPDDTLGTSTPIGDTTSTTTPFTNATSTPPDDTNSTSTPLSGLVGTSTQDGATTTDAIFSESQDDSAATSTPLAAEEEHNSVGDESSTSTPDGLDESGDENPVGEVTDTTGDSGGEDTEQVVTEENIEQETQTNDGQENTEGGESEPADVPEEVAEPEPEPEPTPADVPPEDEPVS